MHTPDNYPKWFNSRVFMHSGTVDELPDLVPSFERRAFGLTQTDSSGKKQTRLNGHLDMIVRKPYKGHDNYVPVGVVSKDYALVSHHEVVKKAISAFEKAGFYSPSTRFELQLTENGERMYLSLTLPAQYDYEPGDGYPMELRMECINSVDGSTRFRATMDWHRIVCSNGMIIGTTLLHWNKRHSGGLNIRDLDQVINLGVKEAEQDAENLSLWRGNTIDDYNLLSWINKDLLALWGFKAATRAWHIIQTGRDAKIRGIYKGNTPITIPVELIDPVPGAPPQSDNLYDISQTLAWLAKERRDINERLTMRTQISGLMESLQNNCGV